MWYTIDKYIPTKILNTTLLLPITINMKITYDKIADAAYIRIRKEKSARTIKIKDWLLIDMSATQKLIGIEILNVTSKFKRQKGPEIFSSTPTLSK